MCEHVNNNKDSSSASSTSSNKSNNKHEDTNTFASSSASSTSSHSSKQNNSNKRHYTHNPYAFSNNNNNNKNVIINTQQNTIIDNNKSQQQQVNSSNANNNNGNNKSPAEIELQRGLDSLLITPDAEQLFHTNNNTLHRSLIGNVSFVPYPSEAVEFDYAYYESKSASIVATGHSGPQQFSRVFIGQLPYRVTEMQLQWIFYVFGHGTQIHNPERITKKAKTIGNARVPTGCIHCHILEDKVKGVLQCMHKRLLIDDSGIWYARSEREQDLLEAYIQKLKKQPELRFPDRPYDTMVVQEAVSSYQSSQPRWVSNAPEAEKFAETTPSRKAQILFLQQQKMMKMQQQQTQHQHHYNNNYNSRNSNNNYYYQQQQQSASSSSSLHYNSHNNNSAVLSSGSNNSSTSSHPSEGSSFIAVSADRQQQQQQQYYYNSNQQHMNNNSYHHQQQQQQYPSQYHHQYTN